MLFCLSCNSEKIFWTKGAGVLNELSNPLDATSPSGPVAGVKVLAGGASKRKRFPKEAVSDFWFGLFVSAHVPLLRTFNFRSHPLLIDTRKISNRRSILPLVKCRTYKIQQECDQNNQPLPYFSVDSKSVLGDVRFERDMSDDIPNPS